MHVCDLSENQSRGASALYLSLQWALPLLIVFVQFTVVSTADDQSVVQHMRLTVGSSACAAMASRAWGSDGRVQQRLGERQ